MANRNAAQQELDAKVGLDESIENASDSGEDDSEDEGNLLETDDEGFADSQDEEAEEEEESEGGQDPFGLWSSETVGIKRLKVLLYGVSGVGKTRMAATFPKPLFLDLEGGLRTTLQVGPVLRYPRDPNQNVTTFEEVRQFYAQVKKAPPGTFETVVIDSLNELQILVTQNVLQRFTGVKRQYDDQLTWADYGKANRDLSKVIRLFLNLPYHIVFTAISTQRSPGDEETQVAPKFVGSQVGPDVQRMMDMIGYCHAKRTKEGGSEHYVSFKISPQYIAKDRMGIVSRDIPNNFEALVANARGYEQYR